MSEATLPVGENPTVPEKLSPVSSPERIEVLDMLRGLAILGILMVNMALFFAPFATMFTNSHWWDGPSNVVARVIIQFFAQGKFYTLFSFLFGMGLAIQMERAEAKGRKIGGFFARRMFFLLLIALCHGYLLWFGDILFLYSMLGFLLIAFRNCKPKTLKIWAVVLLLIFPVLQLVGGIIQVAVAGIPEMAEQIAEQNAERQRSMDEAIASSQAAYSQGTVGEVFLARAKETSFQYLIALVAAPSVLAMFLLGLLFGKIGFFRRPEEFLPMVRRWIWPLLVVGVLTNGLFVFAGMQGSPMEPSWWNMASVVGLGLGSPVMCFFYIFAVVLAVQTPRGAKLLSPLIPVGRMALTNYLSHSLVFTTLSYSYGGALYGRVPTVVGLGLTFVMFGLQILFSHWWLGRFRFGPVEWLWRSMTYGKLQPMRR
ncbi:MAG: DUF418 domain-containing protein [Acidobacteriota bacterium]